MRPAMLAAMRLSWACISHNTNVLLMILIEHQMNTAVRHRLRCRTANDYHIRKWLDHPATEVQVIKPKAPRTMASELDKAPEL